MLNFIWEIASTGSHIIRKGYDQVLCTVFRNSYDAWQVAINITDNFGNQAPHFSDKRFADIDDAKSHAEFLLSIREELEPTKVDPCRSLTTFTDWHQQKTKLNGRPTYGRKAGRISLSVKCAQSGKWYFLAHGEGIASKPEGWFSTAEAAMVGADKKHGTWV